MNTALIRRFETAVAVLLSGAVLILLVVRARSAGGLWRDECAIVQLARLPAVSDIAHNFQHEAFPVPFHLLVRTFTSFFGASDVALRCFGLGVGVAVIGAAWFNAMSVRRDVPLFSLSFVGLSAAFLTWGTSVRGYGIGSMMIILAFALVARLLLKPTARRAVLALVICVASVQCLLHNAALVFAIITSALIVSLGRRDPKLGGIVLVIGFISGISLVPYAGAYLDARSWSIVVQSDVDWSSIWNEFNAILGNDYRLVAWIWSVLCFGFLVAGLLRLYYLAKTRPQPEWDILLFSLTSILFGVLAYCAFFTLLSYVPQPWYYVALIAFLAAAFDLLLGTLARSEWIRLARLVVAIAALVALPFADWKKITERQTNVDLIAHELEKRAAPNDLIVVNPWQLGIPFSWYYHGPAPWTTVPSIPDHRIHRYDLIKEKMASQNPIDDVLERIGETLRSGQAIWLVGGIQPPRPAGTALRLAPAPDPRFGWDNVAYTRMWSGRLSSFVRAKALHGEPVALSGPNSVNPLESVPLVVARGWNERSIPNSSSSH